MKPTIIARDCVGGVLYHQLNLKFLSPTINLFFEPEDFNLFCLHLKDYLDGRIFEIVDTGLDYPVGLLIPKKDSSIDKPIKIHFMHYESFEDALKAWNRRKKRIDWDSIYVLSTMCYSKETASINSGLISDWNKISYPKVMLVDQKYGFDDEFVINKPEGCEEYAWLLYVPDKNNPDKRVFNEFDFINFLNQ